MQDPKNEIGKFLKELCTAPSSSRLEALINGYYTKDAQLIHPCGIATSRNGILSLYELYHLQSQLTDIEVLSVVYDSDPEVNALFIEVIAQTYRVFYVPFSCGPTRCVSIALTTSRIAVPLDRCVSPRLNVRVTLRESNGKYYITKQEDYYYPTDLMVPFVYPLVPLIQLYLAFACWAFSVVVWFFVLVSMVDFIGIKWGYTTKGLDYHATPVHWGGVGPAWDSRSMWTFERAAETLDQALQVVGPSRSSSLRRFSE